jgi:hypothetical protein
MAAADGSLHAEWWVGSERVRSVVNGEPLIQPAVVERIEVPAESARSGRKIRVRAREIQAEMADRLRGLRRGWRWLAWTATPEWGTYLLGSGNENRPHCPAPDPRMPLVHFFETSFSRTYERNIIIVEVVSEGLSGLGRDHGGRESLLQRGVDRSRVADCAITWRRGAWPRTRQRQRCGSADAPHSRPQHGARRRGSGGVGSAGAAQRQSAVEGNRRRRAARDSVRRFDRHSGFGGAVIGKIEARTGRRVPAHQDEDQAGLGCRCGPAHSRALPGDPLMADANSAYTLADAPC